MPARQRMLELDQIVVKYGAAVALQGISLNIGKGDCVALLAVAAADAQIAIDVRLLNLHVLAVLALDRQRFENLDGLVRRRAHLLAADARRFSAHGRQSEWSK